MILLDTSVLSRVFRRCGPGPEEIRLRETLADLLSGDVEVGLPGIVLQEVSSGIRLERQFEEPQGRLLSSFSIVRPAVEDYLEAARLKNRCVAAGVNVSGTDCLIAAVAISGPHELFAVDGDFRNIAERTPRLKLYALAA